MSTSWSHHSSECRTSSPTCVARARQPPVAQRVCERSYGGLQLRRRPGARASRTPAPPPSPAHRVGARAAGGSPPRSAVRGSAPVPARPSPGTGRSRSRRHPRRPGNGSRAPGHSPRRRPGSHWQAPRSRLQQPPVEGLVDELAGDVFGVRRGDGVVGRPHAGVATREVERSSSPDTRVSLGVTAPRECSRRPVRSGRLTPWHSWTPGRARCTSRRTG